MHRDRRNYLLDITFNDLMSVMGFKSYFLITLIKSGYARHMKICLMLFRINKATFNYIKRTSRVVFVILTLCGSCLMTTSSHKQPPQPTQRVWDQAEMPPGQRSLLSISESILHQCKTHLFDCCTYTENRGKEWGLCLNYCVEYHRKVICKEQITDRMVVHWNRYIC